MASTDRSPVAELELAPGREAGPGLRLAMRLIILALGCAALIGLGAAQAHARERPQSLDRVKSATARSAIAGAGTLRTARNAGNARAAAAAARAKAVLRAARNASGRQLDAQVSARPAASALTSVRPAASVRSSARSTARSAARTALRRAGLATSRPTTRAVAVRGVASAVARKVTTRPADEPAVRPSSGGSHPTGLLSALTGTVTGLVKPVLTTVTALPTIAVRAIQPITEALVPTLGQITGAVTGVQPVTQLPVVGGTAVGASAEVVTRQPASATVAEPTAVTSTRAAAPPERQDSSVNADRLASRSGQLIAPARRPAGTATSDRHLPPGPERQHLPSAPMSAANVGTGGSSAAAGLVGVLVAAAPAVALRRGRRITPMQTSGATWGLRPLALPG